ncbi:MAG: hypothetical protein ABFC98_00140 [Candidatus Cloacimonas sp.]
MFSNNLKNNELEFYTNIWDSTEVMLVLAKKVYLYKAKDELGPEPNPGERGSEQTPDEPGIDTGTGTDKGQTQTNPQPEPPRFDTIKLSGELPYELWNKFSRSVLTKLNATSNGLVIKIDIKAEAESNRSENSKKVLVSGIQEVKLDYKNKIALNGIK